MIGTESSEASLNEYRLGVRLKEFTPEYSTRLLIVDASHFPDLVKDCLYISILTERNRSLLQHLALE